MSEPQKISGSCHCGKVAFEISEAPAQLVDCNCSSCRRIGALWGHIDPANFILTSEGETISYIHGDRTLSTHSCTNCGCTTFWKPVDPGLARMAVNFRMCDPEVVSGFRVRRFDGADSWEFLDDE